MASIPYIIDQQQGRPESVQAEVTILGAMLLEPEAIIDATMKLASTDFSLDSHRRIYSAMLMLLEDGSAVDMITVGEELRKRKEIEAVGGPAYLASLTEGLPRNLSVENYVRIVKEKAQLRSLMAACDHIFHRAAEQREKADDLVAAMQQQAFSIQAEQTGAGPVAVGDVVPAVVERVQEQRFASMEDLALGYTTGLKALDKLTKGLFVNEYTVIGAEAGSFKTAYAIQIVLANALKGVPCMIFSMEMSKEQIVSRMFASLSDYVRASCMRDPRTMTAEMFDAVRSTAAMLTKLPILIDDTSSLTLDKLLARARLAVRQEGSKLIVGDYLQLIHTDERDNENQRIEEVTFALRDLAKTEKDAHVIALSQLSYAEDGRGKRRLRGSAAIRQSCQNLFYLTCEEESGVLTGRAEIEVDKSREGAKDKISCGIDLNHLRFVDAAC